MGAAIYLKKGVWYAPSWRNPRSGALLPAHSLKTADESEAEIRWTLEQARELSAYEPAQRQVSIAEAKRGDTAFSELLDLYLARKAHKIRPATRSCYARMRTSLLRHIGDRQVRSFAGHSGTCILQSWVNDQVGRLGGRTHTVKKILEAVLKPALRYGHRAKMIDELPDFPEVASDYMAVGRRELVISMDEFVALRAALDEETLIVHHRSEGRKTVDGSIKAYPRLWADLAISTGMHLSDLDNFRGSYWRRLGAQWYRVNSKGASHYPAVWLPCDPFLQATLERAWEVRGGWGPDDRIVMEADGAPNTWMSSRLALAAKAVGLPRISAIDFRHSFACWKRDAGWQFDETAKWLGNSSGMVQRVYAQVPTRRMQELTDGAAKVQAEMLLRKIDGDEPISVEKKPERLATVVKLGKGKDDA
jgi:integrase